MILEGEIRRGGNWVPISIGDALDALKGEDMRCSACHGRMWPHKKYSNGTPAHFEHATAHSGCPQSGYHYTGIKSPHPDALK
jgi:hypothetical protein